MQVLAYVVVVVDNQHGGKLIVLAMHHQSALSVLHQLAACLQDIGKVVVCHELPVLLAEMKHVGDELLQLVRIAQDDAEQLPLIRVSHRVLGGEFAQRPDDECQWSAQLVAGIVEELRLFVAELTHPAVGPTRHRNGAPHEQ